MTCIFCEILARRAPASFIYEDQVVAAFMSLHPTAPGECLVIPRQHIDHFTDVPDVISQQIIRVAQHIGRGMRSVFPLERVGYWCMATALRMPTWSLCRNRDLII